MTEARILDGHVMHARLQPVHNRFRYRIYYLCLPLARLASLPLAVNRPGVMSFHSRDHGACDDSSLENWARTILSQQGIDSVDGDLHLLCMPRVFGYVFNPVSFWLCLDQQKQLRAVLCEVHNTFGDRHTYLCSHSDQHPISATDTLTAEKLFHVSPFLPRNGDYRFRFDYREDHFQAWIDYLGEDGDSVLVTSLEGRLKPLTRFNLFSVFVRCPLVTLKAVGLIHWQALRLYLRRVPFFSRPEPLTPTVSRGSEITKS